MWTRLVRSLAVLAVVAGSGLALPSAEAVAGAEIDVDVFYDRLSPYGRWFWHPRYRQVWAPRGVPVGWRPYTHGRWVYTHDGWLWDSDYPWGWAAFHYGRWLFDDDLGWVWVPGTRWGPAWVAWRYGSGFVGWAPLPPHVDLYRHDDFDLAPPHWVFVEQRYFLTPRLHPLIVLPARNATIFARCPHHARPTFVRQRWVNPGMDVHEIERITRTRVDPVKIREVGIASATGFASDDEVRVYRPAVRNPKKEVAKEAEKARPEEKKAKLVEGAERVRAVRRSEIQEYYDAQAEALRKQQAAESARKRQKQDARAKESLQRQHEAERRALEQGRQREKRTFEARSKIERSPAKSDEYRVRAPAPSKARGAEASKTSARGARGQNARTANPKAEQGATESGPGGKFGPPGRR